MRAIAIAHQNRNLAEFERVLRDYKDGQFLVCPTPPITNVLSRALVRPDNPFSPCRTIRYLTAAKPTPYRRTIFCCRNRLCSQAGRPKPAGSRSKVRNVVRAYSPRFDTFGRLSQMILDKVLHGVLDQGRGCLLVYDELEVDVRIPCSIDRFVLMSWVLAALEHVRRCYRYPRASW